LFHPTTDLSKGYNNSQIAGVIIQNVSFRASNRNTIHAWYLEKPRAHFTVLLSHGNGANLAYRADLIATLIDAGMSVLAYDYEGYGRSEGEPSIETACDDARCAYEYLVKDRKIPAERIILCGESLGTGITGNLASKVRCAGVILQCPFVSLRKRATEILPIEHLYPQACFPENALDNGAVFSKAHAPLLIIGGVLDRILPIHHSEQLYQTALEPKTFIPIEEAGHTGDPALTSSTKYKEGLRIFLASLNKS
jgi:alpha-beta hydrolase superfamily lysophospholipase